MSKPVIDTEERLLKAVNETARVTRAALLFLLVVALYFLIMIGLTTDVMLLTNEKMDLPLMHVGVPVISLYVAAPPLFLLLHVNLLIRLYRLTKTVFLWQQKFGLPQLSPPDLQNAIVFPFDFVNLLLKDGMRPVLWSVIVAQIVILPLIVLIALQVRFLLYPNIVITLYHQLIATVDLISLFVFYYYIVIHLRKIKQ